MAHSLKKVIADGVEEVTFSLSAETETIPAPVVIRLPIPQKDIFCRWTTSLPGVENICPAWGGCFTSNLTFFVPTVTLIGKDDVNRFTLSCSEVSRTIQYATGLREHDSVLDCYFQLFAVPEAPLKEYTATLRIDGRSIFYADAVKDAFKWDAAMDAYKPAIAPVSGVPFRKRHFF